MCLHIARLASVFQTVSTCFTLNTENFYETINKISAIFTWFASSFFIVSFSLYMYIFTQGFYCDGFKPARPDMPVYWTLRSHTALIIYSNSVFRSWIEVFIVGCGLKTGQVFLCFMLIHLAMELSYIWNRAFLYSKIKFKAKKNFYIRDFLIAHIISPMPLIHFFFSWQRSSFKIHLSHFPSKKLLQFRSSLTPLIYIFMAHICSHRWFTQVGFKIGAKLFQRVLCRYVHMLFKFIWFSWIICSYFNLLVAAILASSCVCCHAIIFLCRMLHLQLLGLFLFIILVTVFSSLNNANCYDYFINRKNFQLQGNFLQFSFFARGGSLANYYM